MWILLSLSTFWYQYNWNPDFVILAAPFSKSLHSMDTTSSWEICFSPNTTSRCIFIVPILTSYSTRNVPPPSNLSPIPYHLSTFSLKSMVPVHFSKHNLPCHCAKNFGVISTWMKRLEEIVFQEGLNGPLL